MSRESLTSLYPDVDPLDVVALTMLEGFGTVTAREHLARIRHEGRPFDDCLHPGELRAARKAARAAVAKAERVGARLVMDGDEDFPDTLRDLQAIPTHLWVMGDLRTVSDRRCVAIVGTRQLTGYGERTARSLANAFARHQVTVVSGMARGIDSIAHVAALEAGTMTAAVLGTGVDVPYPVSHRALHKRIRDHGVVISESPPGTAAIPGSFPRRNRLIAALGVVTIVVEAGIKSGALITAECAEAIGRKVGIVPGPIDSPSSLGGNLRLRDGIGHVVATIDDALTLAGISEPGKASVTLENPVEARIWDALERPAANFDILSARSGLPARLCLEAVTTLELRGIVECAITGEVRRR